MTSPRRTPWGSASRRCQVCVRCAVRCAVFGVRCGERERGQQPTPQHISAHPMLHPLPCRPHHHRRPGARRLRPQLRAGGAGRGCQAAGTAQRHGLDGVRPFHAPALAWAILLLCAMHPSLLALPVPAFETLATAAPTPAAPSWRRRWLTRRQGAASTCSPPRRACSSTRATSWVRVECGVWGGS